MKTMTEAKVSVGGHWAAEDKAVRTTKRFYSAVDVDPSIGGRLRAFNYVSGQAVSGSARIACAADTNILVPYLLTGDGVFLIERWYADAGACRVDPAMLAVAERCSVDLEVSEHSDAKAPLAALLSRVHDVNIYVAARQSVYAEVNAAPVATEPSRALTFWIVLEGRELTLHEIESLHEQPETCRSIAQGRPGWDRDLGDEKRVNPTLSTVQKLRKQRNALRAALIDAGKADWVERIEKEFYV